MTIALSKLTKAYQHQSFCAFQSSPSPQLFIFLPVETWVDFVIYTGDLLLNFLIDNWLVSIIDIFYRLSHSSPLAPPDFHHLMADVVVEIAEVVDCFLRV